MSKRAACKEVRVPGGIAGFMEDKDEAKRLRLHFILPAVQAGENVLIDFSEVKRSTQSFIHALIGEILQRYKEEALNRLEFRSCAPQVKSLIQLVVDYSLGGFVIPDRPPAIPGHPPSAGPMSPRQQKHKKRQ